MKINFRGLGVAARRVIRKPEAAAAKMLKRYDTVVGDALRIASRLIVEEEKDLVPAVKVSGTAFSKVREENWTTNATAVLVARKLWSHDAAPIIEKCVRGGGGSAIELAERTMPLIRTALGNQLDLSAAAATF